MSAREQAILRLLQGATQQALSEAERIALANAPIRMSEVVGRNGDGSYAVRTEAGIQTANYIGGSSVPIGSAAPTVRNLDGSMTLLGTKMIDEDLPTRRRRRSSLIPSDTVTLLSWGREGNVLHVVIAGDRDEPIYFNTSSIGLPQNSTVNGQTVIRSYADAQVYRLGPGENDWFVVILSTESQQGAGGIVFVARAYEVYPDLSFQEVSATGGIGNPIFTEVGYGNLYTTQRIPGTQTPDPIQPIRMSRSGVIMRFGDDTAPNTGNPRIVSFNPGNIGALHYPFLDYINDFRQSLSILMLNEQTTDPQQLAPVVTGFASLSLMTNYMGEGGLDPVNIAFNIQCVRVGDSATYEAQLGGFDVRSLQLKGMGRMYEIHSQLKAQGVGATGNILIRSFDTIPEFQLEQQIIFPRASLL